mmetsp:Transcript_96083/g.200722  ORF Transcript_96083/g.200722 Transcript_96083/m.200722 type:complete len:108 (+) Transcript_96083:56-379(+)
MPPKKVSAVAKLQGDLKLLAAFEAAAEWKEQASMERAFRAISWDDPQVKAVLPEYVLASPADRAKVDYAFGALVPRAPQGDDPREAVIHTWIKARLFAYNKVAPFKF